MKLTHFDILSLFGKRPVRCLSLIVNNEAWFRIGLKKWAHSVLHELPILYVIRLSATFCKVIDVQRCVLCCAGVWFDFWQPIEWIVNSLDPPPLLPHNSTIATSSFKHFSPLTFFFKNFPLSLWKVRAYVTAFCINDLFQIVVVLLFYTSLYWKYPSCIMMIFELISLSRLYEINDIDFCWKKKLVLILNLTNLTCIYSGFKLDGIVDFFSVAQFFDDGEQHYYCNQTDMCMSFNLHH